VVGTVLDHASGKHVAVEAQHAARASADRARDLVTAQTKTFGAMTDSARGVSSLVATLAERPDARTLGEKLAAAPWWEPYRMVSAAVSYRENVISFAQPGMRGLPFGELVAQVRRTGDPVSAILAGPLRAHLCSAVALPGPSYLPPAILVLARPIDEPDLERVAEAANGAVMMVDGQRPVGRAGEGSDLLEAALRSGRVDGGQSGWAMSTVTLGPGMALWVGTRPEEIIRTQASADRKRKALVWTLAVLLSAPLLIVAFRAKPKPPPRRRAQTTRFRPPTLVPTESAPMQPAAPAMAAAPVAPPPLRAIDAVLARYTLVDRIAEGAMAEVFTAISQGGGGPRRSLVVKRLRPELTGNAGAIARFTEEASLISKLSHSAMVPVFDCGEVDGDHFIAEEYVVGRDLERITRALVQGGRPPLSTAGVLYVMHEVLAGLGYLHSSCPGQDAPEGFLHHDLSPRKVMVSRLGMVKLLDFRIVRADRQVPATELGGAKGPVEYMSPEQARGRAIDQRSDLFSAGLVLYHAAAGESLYRGDTQYDRLSRAVHGPGLAELDRINALPAPFPALLTRALQVHPERRFQSAAEFADALAPYIVGGEDDVAGVIGDLFGEALQTEIDRLSSAVPAPVVAGRLDRRPT
jgi:hypothetical protein